METEEMEKAMEEVETIKFEADEDTIYDEKVFDLSDADVSPQAFAGYIDGITGISAVDGEESSLDAEIDGDKVSVVNEVDVDGALKGGGDYLGMIVSSYSMSALAFGSIVRPEAVNSIMMIMSKHNDELTYSPVGVEDGREERE